MSNQFSLNKLRETPPDCLGTYMGNTDYSIPRAGRALSPETAFQRLS